MGNFARELFDYDAETGELRWRVRPGNRVRIGYVAGCPCSGGYLYVRFNGRKYLAHRLVWLHVHGVWPTGQIDHRDGDRTNNRIANLRDVSRSVNQQNQRLIKRSTVTGLLGVTLNRASFRAAIVIDGKRRNLGSYRTPDAAHTAYIEAKRVLHPGFTDRGS